MSGRTETSGRGGKKKKVVDDEIAMAQDLIRRHSTQSSSKGAVSAGSSDSDSTAARFRTPVSRKRKSHTSPPRAPKKEKISTKEHQMSDSEDEGDLGHKRSKNLLKKYETVKDEEMSEEDGDKVDNVMDLKKQIVALKRKLKGSLKGQTIMISMALDKKNKELLAKNEELKKKSKEKCNAIKEESVQEIGRLRKDKEYFKNKWEKEGSHLNRVRKERNKAEDRMEVMKKEITVLIETAKAVREELKGKDVEIIKLKNENDNLKTSQVQNNSEDGESTSKKVLEEETTIPSYEENGGEGSKATTAVKEAGEEGEGRKDVANVNEVSVNTTEKDGESSPILTKKGKKNDGEGSKDVVNVKEVAITTNEEDRESSPILTKKDKKNEDYYADYKIEDFPSDEEWETVSRKNVGNFIIYNHTNAKDSRSRTVKLPKRVIAAAKRFTMTSMNNKAMFIVLNANSVSKHNPGKGRPSCGLSPACSATWKKDDPIAMIFLFDVPENPFNETEVWVCKHHQEASISGVNLQTQKQCKFKGKEDEETDPFKDLAKLKNAMKK